ncbi:acyl-CoA synthetase family member 2, mitochondrial [Galendromus occidentalis]|uniref:Acyl-CoA synthetase family member 2, mitochondrial n=1 Tax=Galendromus occidentalis TaxID=34638 RepID=A0AAJ6QU21_9ACAR|nr:acyl-CoA synthetase family member 2, mitochondrial [Galendromus occidentalis]
MRLRKSNLVLASLPLYHSFGYICIEATDTLNGLSTVYTSMKPKPREVLQAIAEEKVTTLHGTPTTFYDILRSPDFGKTDISSLENGTIGATTLHPAAIAEIIANLNLRDFMTGYGLTETSGACSFGDGKDFRGYELFDETYARILKENGSVAGPGEKGEIQLKGPTVFKEYLNDREKTTAVLDGEGWFRTGDLGTMNEDRKLIVSGRVSDLIIKGGVNISPAEIEPVLMEHPSILEAHVVGVGDDRLGEEVCAWIKLRADKGCSEEHVRDFAAKKLSRIKVPKYVIVTDEFPKTSLGKISKMKLREAFELMRKKD